MSRPKNDLVGAKKKVSSETSFRIVLEPIKVP